MAKQIEIGRPGGLPELRSEPEVGLGHSAGIPDAKYWECFGDAAYFDMWCVRQCGSRTFGEGYHLVNRAEAEHLCETLNRLCASWEKANG